MVLLLVALVTDVAIPIAIAIVLAAILVPLTDRLEGWHLPRWLRATLVLLLALAVVVGPIARVIRGIVTQGDEIWRQLESGLQRLNNDLDGTSSSASTLVAAAHNAVQVLTLGVLGSLISSAASLVVSVILAVFILLFLLKDWDEIRPGQCR